MRAEILTIAEQPCLAAAIAALAPSLVPIEIPIAIIAIQIVVVFTSNDAGMPSFDAVAKSFSIKRTCHKGDGLLTSQQSASSFKDTDEM